MESWSSYLYRGVFGDPNEAGLLPPVQSYEDIHGVTQGILLPPTYPKGISFHLLHPMSRTLAIQQKCVPAFILPPLFFFLQVFLSIHSPSWEGPVFFICYQLLLDATAAAATATHKSSPPSQTHQPTNPRNLPPPPLFPPPPLSPGCPFPLGT